MGGTRTLLRSFFILLPFAGAGLLLCLPQPPPPHRNTWPLHRYLADIDTWKGVDIPIEGNILEALDVDDYLFKTYRKGDKTVTVYIGFYTSMKKGSTTHSPLVCFPGQGWTPAKQSTQHVDIQGNAGRFLVRGTRLEVEKGGKKELVFFWYQARDKSVPDSFRQKMITLINTTRFGDQANAFVRISLPIVSDTDTTADQTLVEFVSALYPSFRTYMMN